MVTALKQWRDAEGRRRGLCRALTFEEAAHAVVVDGEPVNKSTWHGWETGKKVPSRAHMPAVCDLVGVSSDVFYELRGKVNTPPPAQELLV